MNTLEKQRYSLMEHKQELHAEFQRKLDDLYTKLTLTQISKLPCGVAYADRFKAIRKISKSAAVHRIVTDLEHLLAEINASADYLKVLTRKVYNPFECVSYNPNPERTERRRAHLTLVKASA